MDHGSEERLKSLELAAEMHRGTQGNLRTWDLERVLTTAEKIAGFVLYGNFPFDRRTQPDTQTSAPDTAATVGHIDPPTSNVVTLKKDAATAALPAEHPLVGDENPEPAPKERKPRGPKKTAKAKGKPGRKPRAEATVSEAASVPPIANGAGEHVSSEQGAGEPQMAA